MRALALPLLALLQWQPTVGCGSCTPYAPPPPRMPQPYDSCTTAADCPASTSCMGSICSQSCSADSDCPAAPMLQTGSGTSTCIRIGAQPAFCAILVSSDTAACVDERQGLSRKFVGASSGTTPADRWACVPTSVSCGDNECVFPESTGSCPLDCFYATCTPPANPGAESAYCGCCSEGSSGVALDCIAVGRTDGGRTSTGICSSPHITNPGCTVDAGCLARGGFPGACLSGFSVFPICVQSCRDAGQDGDCLPEQRCVALQGSLVCVPSASSL